VHKRRGQKRKERTFGNNDDSAHILDQYDALTGKEQHQEGELEDDGPALAAFNMDEAEQEEAGLGGGERKGEEEEDAWLQSLEDQVALLLLPLVHMETYARMQFCWCTGCTTSSVLSFSFCCMLWTHQHTA
jgi:hypothetical protein